VVELCHLRVEMSTLFDASLSLAAVVVTLDLLILSSSTWHEISWTRQSVASRRWLRLTISIISFLLGIVLLISTVEAMEILSERLNKLVQVILVLHTRCPVSYEVMHNHAAKGSG
jgi:uncharacterized membrane protein HdeD (DUF308 family)